MQLPLIKSLLSSEERPLGFCLQIIGCEVQISTVLLHIQFRLAHTRIELWVDQPHRQCMCIHRCFGGSGIYFLPPSRVGSNFTAVKCTHSLLSLQWGHTYLIQKQRGCSNNCRCYSNAYIRAGMLVLSFF